jgi:hypoxanthine phosphoribosyltransferase
MEIEKKPCKILFWDDVYELSKNTAMKIIESGFKPDIVIGLARGGWFTARIICDYLNIDDLVSMKVEHWGTTAKISLPEARLKYPFEVDLKGKKVLLVDDITDTGESLILAKNVASKLNPSEIRTAVMQYMTSSKIKPDYYAEVINDWIWMVYPWNWIDDFANFSLTILKSSNKPLKLQEMRKLIKEYYNVDPIKISKEHLKNVLEILEKRELVARDGERWIIKK